MKNCEVQNPANGGNSLLRDELLRVFKNQARADFEYEKVLGEDFKKVFGDWEAKHKAIANNESVIPNTGNTYPTGEPELINKKGTRQYYYKLQDGSKLFVDRKGLRGSFSPLEIRDVSKFFLFRFVQDGGSKSFNELDTEKDKTKIMVVIEKAIADYKATIEAMTDDNPWKDILMKRINSVELYKEDWKDELIFELDSLGQRYREKITDAEGNPVTEVAEGDKSTGLSIQDSVTVDPKTTATTNTKIFLSQIISQEMNEDGSRSPINSEFLGTPVFEDFNQVWEVLQPLLSDLTVTGDGENVVSTYSKMMKKIELLKDVKPWAYDLYEKLDSMYNGQDNERSKVYELVQAFNKNKLDFNVTEFNRLDDSYKVINATATNSRESQILRRWGNLFNSRWLDDVQSYMNNDNKATINAIQDDIEGIYDSLNAKVLDANKALKDGIITEEEHSDERAQVYMTHIPQFFEKLREMGIFGLEDVDLNAYIMLTGGMDNLQQTTSDLFTGFRILVNGTLTKEEHKFKDEDGNFANPFLTQKVAKTLAQAMAYRELDIAESTVLGPDGSTYFTYSNPTYVNNKINEWKEDPADLIEKQKYAINGNSQWIAFLLADDVTNNAKLKEKTRIKRMEGLQSSIASSFTSAGRNDGVNNVHISLYDQINDNMTKMLADKVGGKSLFPTIIAADKSRRIELKGFDMFDSGITTGKDGNVVIPRKTTGLFTKYFEDEFNRMMEVERDFKSKDENDLVEHYHLGRANGKKSQLFPEFSWDNKDAKYKALRDVLYDADGNPRNTSTGIKGFSDGQRAIVEEAIAATLKERFDEHYEQVEALANDTKINQRLLNAYKGQGGLVGMTGDYMINGLISTIEYTKMFSGDPAYFKNLPDLIKRVPATYTDGLQLSLETGDDLKFTMAVVQGVEVASQYQKLIYDSLSKENKGLAKAYGKWKDGSGSNVNTTDAQAWITPRRWRFIKKRLGQWSNKHDDVYAKMLNGKELDDNEMKLAAQPLKGVYFEINNGVPTYLKYSQAVIIPAMAKGTPMEGLLNKMQGPIVDGKYSNAVDNVQEVVTIDGVKVGAFNPTKINVDDTTSMVSEDQIELNVKTLNNKGWKLQQDLPIKTMHETNLGSQIQKNILEGLKLDQKYKIYGMDATQDGAVLLQKVHDAISRLSDIGKEEVNAKLGIDANAKIADPASLYSVLIEEFKSRGGNENIIAALEKETRLEAIPQIKGRIDSILMSIFNKAMTKIATEGGSYIQVSPFGYEELIGEVYEGGLSENEQNELDELRASLETSNDNFEYIVLNEMPKITPESAKKETSLKVGIKQDINPSWLSKDGKTIEKAAEDIYADHFSDGTGLSIQDIRNLIIENIQKTKSEAMSSFTGGSRIKELETKEKTGEWVKGANKSNVKIVSDRYNGKGLLPPRKGEDGQTLPGQVMIPHTLAIKLLRQAGMNPDKMKPADWLKVFQDPKTRELVGYRIPNQGMSSNDTLEIVGVLPATMGDSIIGYDAIPAKTGSDFDIDKMYMMAPNLMFNKKSGQFEQISEDNKQFYKGNKSVDKLIAQNNVLNLYTDILQSPLTYDNMMTSIDSSYLKKDIDKLHGVEVPKNLDTFSPITQLQTKMNYMSGKMGVALTANQLVDHVANQPLDLAIRANLGLAGVGMVQKVEGSKKSKTLIDRPVTGRSIADSLSAFLNAYVDIAKDPYVTKGNHNDVTANVSFMLIRAGVPVERLNRYIGQPILKEYVNLKKRQDSITAKPLIIVNEDGTTSNATPMEFLRNKYKVKSMGKADKSHIQLGKMSNAELESRIKEGISIPEGDTANYVDSIVLNAFEMHEKLASQFTDAVLAAKVDTKGAGGSPVSLNVNINKIRRAEQGIIMGYTKKFEDTALETYTANSLYYVRTVLRNSGIFIDATDGAVDMMNEASTLLTRDELLVNEDLGKSVSGGIYAYMMSGTQAFSGNRERFDDLFVDLPKRIQKLQESGTENFLLKELEIDIRGGYHFLGINNRNKPAQYQNNIYRGWMDLYEDSATKEMAVDLAKYAYSQSGFQMNLNQFFSHIPHEILRDEGLTSDVGRMMDNTKFLMGDSYFMDQFIRHEANNTDVVPRVKATMLTIGENELEHGFMGNDAFNQKYLRRGATGMVVSTPSFISVDLGEGQTGLYKKVDEVYLEDPQDEMAPMYPVYKRTHKLGYKAGKNRVFEYNYDKKVDNSILEQNQFDPEFKDAIETIVGNIVKKFQGFNPYANSMESQMMEAEFDQQVKDLHEDLQEEDNLDTFVDEMNGEAMYKPFNLTLDMFKNEDITKTDC